MRAVPVGGMRGIFAQRQRFPKPDLVRTVAMRAPQAHPRPRWIGPTKRVFSSRISSPKTPRVWGALSACAFSPPLFGDQGNPAETWDPLSHIAQFQFSRGSRRSGTCSFLPRWRSCAVPALDRLESGRQAAHLFALTLFDILKKVVIFGYCWD